MNKTEQAKYDLANKMLKGKIEISEVVMMTGLSEDIVQKLKDEIEPTEKSILDGLNIQEIGPGGILVDNEILEEDL